MSTLTGGTLNLIKPELTDDHKVTIGTDLPANFQKIDDRSTAHSAETVSYVKLETVDLATAGSSITVSLLADRIPKSITLLAVMDGTLRRSHGVWSPNAQYCIYWRSDGSVFEYSPILGLIKIDASNVARFTISSVAPGSCTLAYTKTGSPTGTAQLIMQVLYHD